jgi:hypothetical protein
VAQMRCEDFSPRADKVRHFARLVYHYCVCICARHRFSVVFVWFCRESCARMGVFQRSLCLCARCCFCSVGVSAYRSTNVVPNL